MKAAPSLDARGKALFEEDLRSPCTEEIAVFRAFAQKISQGECEFVVLDTAPTGHTLLLMDAAQAYHREVSRTTSEIPEAVRGLLPRLRDGRFTRVVLVTLPEATPVHEAARLQQDLVRAGIQPFAWVVNQSFAAEVGLPGRIPHDFRRTAVRNLVRAGIPERVAMMMTGHKTRSVFERYNIVSSGDLTDAARKLDEASRKVSERKTEEKETPAAIVGVRTTA
jgi:anion-transporting  ArsA/GET3 family ATPase